MLTAQLTDRPPARPHRQHTLLWLLNTDRIPREWRNRAWSNVVLALCAAAFITLVATELQKAVANL